MKRIQNLWILLLTTLSGWLLQSCAETSHMVLYGPPPVEDAVGEAVCLYGIPPGRWEKPEREGQPQDTPASPDNSNTEEEK